MAPSHMTTTTLKVEGMTCGACTSAVESGLQNLDGVGSVSVSLVMERAVVSHDASRISAQEIRDVVEDRGFDAEVLASDGVEDEDEDEEGLLLGGEEAGSGLTVTTVRVGGMTCGACTSAVEGAFKNVAGVKSFSISLLSERAVVEHDAEILSPEQVAEMIEDTGFDAEIVESKEAEPVVGATTKSRRRSERRKLVTTTVAIEGMTCGACTSAVEGGFKDI